MSNLPPTESQGAEIRDLEREGYDRVAATYSVLTRLGLADYRKAFIAAASIQPGQSILDVCCGPGWLTLEAAVPAGPEGRAVGVDLSPAMIDAARNNAAESASPNVTFEVMDAESLALADATFDRVLCSFGLMHVPDVERAASEMGRVLRSRGRVVLTVWGTAEETPYLGLLIDSLRATAADHLPVDPGYFLRLGPSGVLEGVLERAGFEAVSVTVIKHSISYPGVSDGESYFDSFATTGGLFSSLLRRLPPDAVRAARAEFGRRAAAYKVGDSLSLPAAIHLAVASRRATG